MDQQTEERHVILQGVCDDLEKYEHQLLWALDTFSNLASACAYAKGFHDEKRPFSEKIALMHSELSEALEADRKGLKDDKLKDFDGAVVELADCMIRIFDVCGQLNLPLGVALITKMRYNLGRPYKHGKKY